MIKTLAIIPGIIPSTSILIIKPLLQLHFQGHIRLKIELESRVRPKQIEWADLVFFCRNTEPRFRNNLDRISQLGIPYIYDLDDNFFELPDNNELGAYHRHPDRIAMLKEYLEKAALVRVYSPAMFQYIRPMNENAIQSFAPIDFRRIDASPKRPNGRIKIVFSTSSRQNDLLAIALPALDKILQRCRDKVEVHFWGARPESMANRSNVFFHKFIMDYDRFLRRFSQAQFDIGLAPMKDDLFHRSKTNNKFREYGACGIAGVYSDVEVYSGCVQNETTGLLVANDSEAWYRAIAHLIEDPELRQRLKDQSRDYVRLHYSQEQFELISREMIQQITRNGRTVKTIASKPILPGKERTERIRNWRNHPISSLRRALFLRWSLLKYRVKTKTPRISLITRI